MRSGPRRTLEVGSLRRERKRPIRGRSKKSGASRGRGLALRKGDLGKLKDGEVETELKGTGMNLKDLRLSSNKNGD